MTIDTPQIQQAPGTRFAWRRPLKRLAKTVVVVVPLVYFLPKLFLLYALCGIYDVSRNRIFNRALLDRYFLGNGVFTWIVSPLNVLMDILCLPYRNKGVYRLEDLPVTHQRELQRIFQAAKDHYLVEKLEEKTRGQARSMFFFKWYGANLDTDLAIPEFHEPYRYVKTIGVSVFNRREATNEHFGFMRASLRVLYNINDIGDQSAYIKVGPSVSYWQDDKLFIFDDTLLHKSVNDSDQSRYCLFIDILRPSYLSGLLGAVVAVARVLTRPFNNVFYLQWKLLRP